MAAVTARIALTAAEGRRLLELARRAPLRDPGDVELLATLMLHVVAAERQAVRP